jgi:hypothetical protein
MSNPGFDPQEIAKIKKRCQQAGKNYVLNEEEEQAEEFVHFYFIGQYEGREVIYDAVLFTLSLYHSSLLMEKAEEAAEKQFPGYKRINFEEMLDEEEDLVADLAEENEEIELFKMEYMEELEETEAIKVREYLEIDPDFDYGIALEVALNEEEIDQQVIQRFVSQFNNKTFTLDPTLYSFKTEEEEEEG